MQIFIKSDDIAQQEGEELKCAASVITRLTHQSWK